MKKKESSDSFYNVLCDNRCKFIFGDIKDKTATFCQNERYENKPYCKEHSDLCLIKTTALNFKSLTKL